MRARIAKSPWTKAANWIVKMAEFAMVAMVVHVRLRLRAICVRRDVRILATITTIADNMASAIRPAILR